MNDERLLRAIRTIDPLMVRRAGADARAIFVAALADGRGVPETCRLLGEIAGTRPGKVEPVDGPVSDTMVSNARIRVKAMKEDPHRRTLAERIVNAWLGFDRQRSRRNVADVELPALVSSILMWADDVHRTLDSGDPFVGTEDRTVADALQKIAVSAGNAVAALTGWDREPSDYEDIRRAQKARELADAVMETWPGIEIDDVWDVCTHPRYTDARSWAIAAAKVRPPSRPELTWALVAGVIRERLAATVT